MTCFSRDTIQEGFVHFFRHGEHSLIERYGRNFTGLFLDQCSPSSLHDPAMDSTFYPPISRSLAMSTNFDFLADTSGLATYMPLLVE